MHRGPKCHTPVILPGVSELQVPPIPHILHCYSPVIDPSFARRTSLYISLQFGREREREFRTRLFAARNFCFFKHAVWLRRRRRKKERERTVQETSRSIIFWCHLCGGKKIEGWKRVVNTTYMSSERRGWSNLRKRFVNTDWGSEGDVAGETTTRLQRD